MLGVDITPRTILANIHTIRIVALILDTDIITAATFFASPPKSSILSSSCPGHLFLL